MKTLCLLESISSNLPEADLYFSFSVLHFEKILRKIGDKKKILNVRHYDQLSWRDVHESLAEAMQWESVSQKEIFENLWVHELSEQAVYGKILEQVLQKENPAHILTNFKPDSPIASILKKIRSPKMGVTFYE